MKTNIQETSLMAYEEVKISLNRRQFDVLRVIAEAHEPISSKQIAKRLNLPINSIVGRVNELLYEKQFIRIAYKKDKESYYVFRTKTQPLNHRRLTPTQKIKKIKQIIENSGFFVCTEEIKKILEL